MQIYTRLQLITYVREMLGAPQIEIEVTDNQISDIIDDAIQLFTEYAYGTLEATLLIELKGKGEYKLPRNVTNIIKLSKGGTSNIANFASNFGDQYVPELWSQQFFSSSAVGDMTANLVIISNTVSSLQKYFGDDIYYNWNPYKKVLQIFDTYKGKAVLHFNYEYHADEEDAIYGHEWIKRYVIARTKILWGQITGKYSSSLVGGATINYADMKSEGNDELEKLKEELLDKYSDPCPIDVA